MGTNKSYEVPLRDRLSREEPKQRVCARKGAWDETGRVGFEAIRATHIGKNTRAERADNGGDVVHELDKICCSDTPGRVLGEQEERLAADGLHAVILRAVDLVEA